MTIGTYAAPGEQGARPMLGAADWLGLAATPTFAGLALITGLLDRSPQDALCAAMPTVVPFDGMTLMYLLMGVFHTAPWLRLVARWRNGV